MDQLAGQIYFEAIPTATKFQVAFVARRFGLAAPQASLIASLAFGEARHG